MSELALRAAQAGRQLNITPHQVRRLCELGLIAAERTTGGHWQIPISEIERLKKEGVPPIPVEIASEDEPPPPEAETPEPDPPACDAQPENFTVPPPSERVATAREDVLITASRLEKRRIEKDLEETEDFFRARQEQQAIREAAGRKEALEEQEQARKRQWVQEWAQFALSELDRIPGVPEEYRLPVYREAERALNEMAQIPADPVTKRLVSAAIATALRPWHRRQGTDRIIEKAKETLPASAKNTRTPTEWELRARRAAAEAIGELPDDAPEAQRESAAILAVSPIIQEFEHRERCNAIAAGILLPGATHEELTHARETVFKALEGQPPGTSDLAMKKTAMETLRPFQEEQRIRANQAMRNRVADYAPLMWNLDKESADQARDEVRQAIDNLPGFTPQPELERVRTEILERARARQERQKQKAQLVETGLGEIHAYLVGLENRGYRFSEPPVSVSQKVREPIRKRLEEMLRGSEDIEVVKTRVRRLAKEHLDIRRAE